MNSFMKLSLPFSLLLFVLSNCSQDNNPIASDKKSAFPDSSSGIFAKWTFQGDSESTLIDSSSYALNGYIKGAKRTIEDGHVALKFDGRYNYIKMEKNMGQNLKHLSQLGDGSISIWFKLNSLPVGQSIYPIFYYGSSSACDFFDAANKGMIIEVGHHPVQPNSKRLYFTIWSNGCTYPSFCFDSNHAMEPGKWYHFVAIVGPDYNTGYLNGKEMIDRRYNFNDAEASQFFANALAHEALWLGRGYWDGQMNYFDGFIGDVRIYADPLTENQVKQLYQEVSAK